MRNDLFFHACVAGSWLGIGLGGWQLLQHNPAGAIAGLLLSSVCAAALIAWDVRSSGPDGWSALSGVALLLVTCALLTHYA